MPTSLDIITSGLAGLSVGVRQSYDKTMLAYNKPEIIHAQFAEERTIPQGEGATINFRRMDRFAVATTPLVEGITPNPSTVSEVGLSMTPLQYGKLN